MAQKLNLTICHLYPDLMDTYGDIGNIITLVQRCTWRNITAKVQKVSLNETLPKDIDIFFFGGGQDRVQELVSKDLLKKKSHLLRAIEKNAVLLSICGGYQLLQKYFNTNDNIKLEGIGLFNAHTEGSKIRMIQNILIDINSELGIDVSKSSKLIGFENHSGKTYLEGATYSLGKVLLGSGNNGEDKTEGAYYKNAFGCYLHGSLLPKNPHFADFLISKALKQKYGSADLKQLDDTFEWKAHFQSIKRARNQS